MSEYFESYHRWEPLAEFHFNIDSEDELGDDDENYTYCLCSRVFIRDGVKTYYVDKEDASESDADPQKDSHSHECEDQSHVHFSEDTPYKVKCEKDEGASCYCSATHTDNYCSTDEHDAAQIHGISHALQPSDSGADLTYQDCHSDYMNHDKIEKLNQDLSQSLSEITENYLTEDSWDKYWAINGERLIWASWIKKYSDYINPAYLNDNKDLILDEYNIPKQKSFDHLKEKFNKNIDDGEGIRERKFSYDSKVNPYKKDKSNQSSIEKSDKSSGTHKDDWLPIGRRRSCSEHDRMLSPRTIATDSMTNVTKITLSSYDVTSSHVTSNSTPTDDYSVSSSTSDDQSNDKTRIANVDENLDQVPSDELDTEQYWQFLWKQHFGEQFALHYANYLLCHPDTGKTEVKNVISNKDIDISNEIIKESQDEKASKVNTKHVDSLNENNENNDNKDKTMNFESEVENSDGNSQEIPSVIEMRVQVDQMNLKEKSKPRKKNKKSDRLVGSVGMLLQNLLKEEQKKREIEEATETGEDTTNKTDQTSAELVDESGHTSSVQRSISNTNFSVFSFNDGDDDPPEDRPMHLKRSHEFDYEEAVSEKIKATFQIMGFSLHPEKMPKGQIVYRKRLGRLRPPRNKRFGGPRKTYFDDDGNPYEFNEEQYSQEENEMLTDDDYPDVKYDTEKAIDIACANNEELNDPENIEQKTDYDVVNNLEGNDEKDIALEASNVELPAEIENSCSDIQDDGKDKIEENTDVLNTSNQSFDNLSKRKRRQKRYAKSEPEAIDDMPLELQGDPKMVKYWRKRHSLFHRFDEGIKLDRESWFSVTPQNVAWHIATKCASYGYDVILDAFCGAGGNTIQFARNCKKVIAIDIDPVKIEMAKHNASVYGVSDQIEFIVGDFFELAPTLSADMVFLSPPWGGPKYSENKEYDIQTMLEPRPASELMEVARAISSNVALYVPRNTRSDQLLSLAKEVGGSVEVEQSYLDRRFVAITAYYY